MLNSGRTQTANIICLLLKLVGQDRVECQCNNLDRLYGSQPLHEFPAPPEATELDFDRLTTG